MNFYIPNNLNIDELIRTTPHKMLSFNKEKALFIIDTIIMGGANGRENSAGYVTVNATVLTDVLGNPYKRYVRYLIEAEVIEQYIGRNGETYLIGIHSQMYRLRRKYVTQVTPYEVKTFTLERRIRQYMKDDAVRARIMDAQERTLVDAQTSQSLTIGAGYSFDKFLETSATEHKKDIRKKSAKTKKVKVTHKSDVLNLRNFQWDDKLFKGMYKWLQDGKLSIDKTLVDTYLAVKLAVQHVDESSRDWEWGKEDSSNPFDQFNAATILTEQLANGEAHKGFFDNSIKRYYSFVSLMPKMIRHALTYEGKNLAVIDISNSQPYMSNLFFKAGFWENEKSTDLKITDLGVIASTIFTPSSFASFIMFLKQASNPLQKRVSFNYFYYKHLTSDGAFYKYLNREIGRMNGSQQLYRELKHVKRLLYILFFSKRGGHNNGVHDVSFKDGFKSLFPTVFEVFSMIKKGNRHNLAHLYFLVETYVVYHRIVLRIQKEFPKMPFWTIHDGIATTVDNVEHVKLIMEEELTKAIGVKPHLKIELWEIKTIENEITRFQSIINDKGLSAKIKEAVANGELIESKGYLPQDR